MLFDVVLPLRSRAPQRFSVRLGSGPLPTTLGLVRGRNKGGVVFSCGRARDCQIATSVQRGARLRTVNAILGNVPFVYGRQRRCFTVRGGKESVHVARVQKRMAGRGGRPLPCSGMLLLAPNSSAFMGKYIAHRSKDFLVVTRRKVPCLVQISCVNCGARIRPCRPALAFRLLPSARLVRRMAVDTQHPVVRINPGKLGTGITKASLTQVKSTTRVLPRLPFIANRGNRCGMVKYNSPMVCVGGGGMHSVARLSHVQTGRVLSTRIVAAPKTRCTSSMTTIVHLHAVHQHKRKLDNRFGAACSRKRSTGTGRCVTLGCHANNLSLFMGKCVTRRGSCKGAAGVGHVGNSTV